MDNSHNHSTWRTSARSKFNCLTVLGNGSPPLMSLGLLRAAWRPGDEVCVVRAVVRQREVLLAEQAAWVLRMQ
ncbi:hypothetical protein GWC77_28625, partial [Paraburkholderia sp. NMBU_R16]|nr:hypothetical protein [Paraburkholderia sp. NMBU_R16]